MQGRALRGFGNKQHIKAVAHTFDYTVVNLGRAFYRLACETEARRCRAAPCGAYCFHFVLERTAHFQSRQALRSFGRGRHIKAVCSCSDHTVVKFCSRFFKSGRVQGGALRGIGRGRNIKAVCLCFDYTVVSLDRAFSSSRLRDGGSRVPEPQAVRRGALPAGGIPSRRHPQPETKTHPS